MALADIRGAAGPAAARGARRRRSGNRPALPITAAMTVLFRVAAGPRIGFGHLVRCRSLARALGVAPRVSIRGSVATRRTAAALGWQVAEVGPGRLGAERPAVLVVDDPSAAAAAPWVRAARRLAIPVASVHDVGQAPVASQLSIDGSVGPTAACGTVGALRGPRFAVLDPAVAAARRHRTRTTPPSVLIALGGGTHARRGLAPLIRALVAAVPQLEVRIAAGFTAAARRRLPAGQVVVAPTGLAPELARATVAIVAGGVTAYEACAVGVPAVVAAVVPAQQVTVKALARAGAIVAGGRFRSAADARRLAGAAARLLADETRRRTLARRGRRLVDGRGAARVATTLRRVADAA